MRNHPTKAGRSMEFELPASLDLGAGILCFFERALMRQMLHCPS